MVKAGEGNEAPRGARSRRPRVRRGTLARRVGLLVALAGPPLAISPAAGAPPGGGAKPAGGPRSGQVSNSGSARNQVLTVDSSTEGQATFLRVRGTRKATFQVHRLEDPARVVVSLADAELAPSARAAGAAWSVKSWAVDRVSSVAAAGGVQVVVWLARPSTFRVSHDGNDLTVLLIAREPAPGEPGAAPTAGTPARAAPPAAPGPNRAKGTTAEITHAEQTVATRRAELRRADSRAKQARHTANKAVRRRSRNSMRLRLTARKFEAEAQTRRQRLEDAEAELAALRGEPAPAVAAATPSDTPASARSAAEPDAGPRAASAAPLAAAPLAAPVPARPSPTAPALRAGSSSPAAASAPAAAASRPAATRPGDPTRATTDYRSPEVAPYGASSGPITQSSLPQYQGRRRKVYRGRKTDVDLKDADIHNLMRLLADVGDVNIVVPDNVKASVTVRLRDVPWDQAMEVILASKGLWYRREGDLIRVAPRKELDAEDQAEAERMRAMAESEAPETQVFTLNYSVANKVRDQLTPLLSPKGRIEVDERTNSLIINDISAHRRRIIGLVTQLDYQTPQIQIEARIIEARSDFRRQLGIQWGGNANASAAGGNSTGLVFPNSVGVAGGADPGASGGLTAAPSNFAVNLPVAVGEGTGGAIGISLGSVGGNLNLNLRLSAAEDTGTVRIISAPRITTSNNIEASIKSGVSIPISVVSANGVQTQFVPADLLLRVTPAVSQRDCAVSMQVNVTKNEADFVNTGARGDPSILTKEAKTTILVADGETAVIGGIYTRNTGVGYSKVPFFADIPVLGWLFKNRLETDNRTEVLVFITPKITNRAFLRCE